MRFTRPGARPCHAVLEGTKLRGGVLGSRVEDERAGSKLGAGEVLELVTRAVRRVELDVEVVVAGTASGRSLVHRHHIRKRTFEKSVVLLEQRLQARRKGLVVVRVEVSESAAVIGRREVNLVGPPREWRH